MGFKKDNRLKQVKSIEHSAILWTFIKLPFVFKTLVLSTFEWPLRTGFSVRYTELNLIYNAMICEHFITFSQ